MSEKITYRSILEECAKANNWVDVPTQEEQIELAKRISDGDTEAKEEMIIRNRRLVYKIQSQDKYSYYPDEEILMAGMEGLKSAVEKFDYTLGYQFSTYATKCIRNKISKEIQNMDELKEGVSKAIKKLDDTINSLRMIHHREPRVDEIAAELKCNTQEVIGLFELKKAKKVLSFNAFYGEDDNSKTIEDCFESTEYSEDAFKVINHTQEEADFDKLRVYAGYGNKVFLQAYKFFNPKVLCQEFPKHQFSHKYEDGEGSILLSYPIISRINTSVIGNKSRNTIDLLKACTEERFKECSEEILKNYIVDMYEDYYKTKKDLKHTIGGEITEEQRKLILKEFPDSPLCNEIKQAKSWGGISVYSIFNCAIKRFTSGEKSGQISFNGFVKNLKMFPEDEKIFPWNREHFRKINGWINGEHSSQNDEEAKHLINDFISALVYKGDITWNFRALSSDFNEYLNNISLLRNVILQTDDPTMLYMRSIEDICSVYCIKNGYPLPEYEALLAVLEKVQNEKKCEKLFVSKITKDGEVLDSWKNMTQVVSCDLMNIFLSAKEEQKERLEKYAKSHPHVVHVKRYNSVHNAVREHFSAQKIPNLIHQCAEYLENKIIQTLNGNEGRVDYARLIGSDLGAWLKETFFITKEELNKKSKKHELEQFKNYLGYDSDSMKYVRNIIIATLFESKEKITKEGMNQALSEMGFVHLNPLVSKFDAVVTQAIALSLQPEIVDEIRMDVIGEAVEVF